VLPSLPLRQWSRPALRDRLLRWPQFGLLGLPARVLPLRQWSLSVLLDRLLRWRQFGLPDLPARVNLFHQQLRSARLDLRLQPLRLTTMRSGSNPA
jgi:hypothetical protein